MTYSIYRAQNNGMNHIEQDLDKETGIAHAIKFSIEQPEYLYFLLERNPDAYIGDGMRNRVGMVIVYKNGCALLDWIN